MGWCKLWRVSSVSSYGSPPGAIHRLIYASKNCIASSPPCAHTEPASETSCFSVSFRKPHQFAKDASQTFGWLGSSRSACVSFWPWTMQSPHTRSRRCASVATRTLRCVQSAHLPLEKARQAMIRTSKASVLPRIYMVSDLVTVLSYSRIHNVCNACDESPWVRPWLHDGTSDIDVSYPALPPHAVYNQMLQVKHGKPGRAPLSLSTLLDLLLCYSVLDLVRL